MRGRVDFSFALGMLRRNAALLLFPIISVLVVGVVSLVLLAPFGMQLIRDAEAGTEPGQIGPFTIALLVICLIADAFVVVFFNGALMSEALVVVRGGHASVGHGLAVAARREPPHERRRGVGRVLEEDGEVDRTVVPREIAHRANHEPPRAVALRHLHDRAPLHLHDERIEPREEVSPDAVSRDERVTGEDRPEPDRRDVPCAALACPDPREWLITERLAHARLQVVAQRPPTWSLPPGKGISPGRYAMRPSSVRRP